jgi:hypothetical protein
MQSTVHLAVVALIEVSLAIVLADQHVDTSSLVDADAASTLFATSATTAAAAAAGSAAVAPSRHEVQTFDYGWRFHLGEPGAPPPSPPAPAPPPPPPPPVPAACKDLAKVFPI